MAGQVVKQASFYFKGKKVGLATGGELSFASNSEDIIADEGVIGSTVGPVTHKLSVDMVVPIGGIGVTLLDAMLRQETVQYTVGIVDGKIIELEGRIPASSYSWDAKSGMQTGKYEFTGGKPKSITG